MVLSFPDMPETHLAARLLSSGATRIKSFGWPGVKGEMRL